MACVGCVCGVCTLMGVVVVLLVWCRRVVGSLISWGGAELVRDGGVEGGGRI